MPVEEDWDTRAYLRHLPGVFEAVRNEFGPELPLLHDGHHRMTPIQAAKLGKSLEPYDLFWLEDCTPAENQEALRLVRQHTTTPLAIGEIFNTVWDYQDLIREQLIDYVRGAVTHMGGIIAAEEDARLRGACTRSSPACTGRPTSRRSAWPPRCTSGWRSTTSASRSTCSTAPRPTRCSEQSFTWDGRAAAPRRQARPRRRAGRRRGGQVPVRAGVPAVQPARRRHRPRLVMLFTGVLKVLPSSRKMGQCLLRPAQEAPR